MTLDTSPTDAAARRSRDKNATLQRLQAAMVEVKNSGRKLSIKAVAEAAGVDPSLIHHVYPHLAEEVRTQAGKSTRSQRDEKHQALVSARQTIQEQRAEIAELKADLAKLASINLELQDRIDEYETGRLHVTVGQ